MDILFVTMIICYVIIIGIGCVIADKENKKNKNFENGYHPLILVGVILIIISIGVKMLENVAIKTCLIKNHLVDYKRINHEYKLVVNDSIKIENLEIVLKEITPSNYWSD